MIGFNGHDKQTVYVAIYVLQYMAIVYYCYRDSTIYIIIGTI